VGEDRREEFERAVTEFTARADAEPGTLVFRFFRGAPGQYAVVEEYVNADLHGPVGEGIRKWALRVRDVSLYEDPVAVDAFRLAPTVSQCAESHA
jgi:hypothetical protein